MAYLTTYLEPDLYALAASHADESKYSYSAWLRKLIISELAKCNKITPDMMAKLAAG